MKKGLLVGGSLAVVATALLALGVLLPDHPAMEQAPAPKAKGVSDSHRAPNLLLITLDTTRADRLGCYGYQRALTPALDGLAARGAMFEQAFTSCPMTLPAHATIFTGLDPPEHGVRVNGKHRLGTSLATLAERLAEEGYRTGGFVAAFVMSRKFGLERGFETYDDDLTGAHDQEVPEPLSVYRPGNLVVDAALAWLREVTAVPPTDAAPEAERRRFFAWVHLYDPHYPYHPHPELGETVFTDDASYDAEVAFMDRQVARLLAFLHERQLTTDTLVIAVGDHGEGLDDHGEVEHGYLLNEEVLRVPLIVSLPGTVQAGEWIGAMVTLADLFPTVLDLLGIATPAQGRGRSLVPALLHGESMPSEPSYAETDLPYTTFGWSPLRSLTTPQWKYVRTPRPELFDRAADPRELFNLASARPQQLQELEGMLAAFEATMTASVAPEVTLDAEERRRLESLGYLAGGTAPVPPDDVRLLKDIKDMLPTKQLAARLRRGMATGTMDDAEMLEITRKLVRQSPETASFRQHLGAALVATGKLGKAVEHLTEAVRLDPTSAEIHYALGDALARQGKREEAMRHFADALRLDPEFAPAHVGMGNALADRLQLDVAAGHYAEALRLQPAYAEAHYNLANTLAQRGKVELALTHYREALRTKPDFAEAHYNLANLLREQGRAEDAITHYREAVRLEPDNVHAHNNLGVALEIAGQNEEAKGQYLEALRIKPDFPRPYTNLGNLLAAQGQYAAALTHYAEVVRLRRDAAEPASRLAWLLATCPDAQIRDAARAVQLAEHACEATNHRNAQMLDTLAAAYAEAGRFEEAVTTATRALHVAHSQRRERLAADIQHRIELYASARPFHDRRVIDEPAP